MSPCFSYGVTMTNSFPAIIATSNKKNSEKIIGVCRYCNVEFVCVYTFQQLIEHVQQTQYAFLIIADLLNNNSFIDHLTHIRNRSVDKYLPIIALYDDVDVCNHPKISELRAAPFDILHPSINEQVLICKIQLFLTLNHQKNALQKEIQNHFQSLTAKKEFFSNINHEFRTPLNTIVGMTELLVGSELYDEQKKYVQTIRRSGELLLAMINTIIDYSKIKSGTIEISSKPFQLKKILQKTIELLSGKLQAKHTELIEKIDSKVPEYISGDVLRFEQLLFNILDVAIHQTISNAITLNVRLHGKQDEKIILYMSIEDSNMELSDMHMASLKEEDSIENNTHVGLYVSRKIVEEMGGNIGFQKSHENKTELWCTLTFSKTAQESNKCVENPYNEDADEKLFECSELLPSDIRVLLVEDNQINVIVTANLLKKIGFKQITVVENGKDAVEHMTQKDYDFVLMDIHMPVMDGFEASRLIRNHIGIRNPNVPIIALSAQPVENLKKECSENGINDFISKPFTKNKLISVIKEVFPEIIFDYSNNDKQNRTKKTIPKKDKTLLLFDKKNLLERLEGDEALYQELIQGFLSDIPVQINKLEKAIVFDDLNTAERLAHTLKGAFSNVGAQLLQKNATELETFIKNDEPEKISHHMIQLKDYFDKITDYI